MLERKNAQNTWDFLLKNLLGIRERGLEVPAKPRLIRISSGSASRDCSNESTLQEKINNKMKIVVPKFFLKISMIFVQQINILIR